MSRLKDVSRKTTETYLWMVWLITTMPVLAVSLASWPWWYLRLTVGDEGRLIPSWQVSSSELGGVIACTVSFPIVWTLALLGCLLGSLSNSNPGWGRRLLWLINLAPMLGFLSMCLQMARTDNGPWIWISSCLCGLVVLNLTGIRSGSRPSRAEFSTGAVIYSESPSHSPTVEQIPEIPEDQYLYLNHPQNQLSIPYANYP